MNYFLFVFLPHLDIYLEIIGFFGLICTFVSLFIYISQYIDNYTSEDIARSIKIGIISIKIFIASLVILSLTIPIPSKKELVELKVINTLQDIKGLDAIPQKIIDNINLLFDINKND
jgi:hypothetical protein